MKNNKFEPRVMLDPDYDEAKQESKDSLAAVFSLGAIPLFKKIASMVHGGKPQNDTDHNNEHHLG